jgi:hypothetical protein
MTGPTPNATSLDFDEEGRFDAPGPGIHGAASTRCSAPSSTHRCTNKGSGNSVMSLVNVSNRLVMKGGKQTEPAAMSLRFAP